MREGKENGFVLQKKVWQLANCLSILRSRRQSTMLVTTATRSVLLQSASPKLGQYVEDTPDNTVKFKGSKVVAETPDDKDDTIFDTSQEAKLNI